MLKEARALLHPQRFLAVQHLETLDLQSIHPYWYVLSLFLLILFYFGFRNRRVALVNYSRFDGCCLAFEVRGSKENNLRWEYRHRGRKALSVQGTIGETRLHQIQGGRH
jgi:hypothetical protein